VKLRSGVGLGACFVVMLPIHTKNTKFGLYPAAVAARRHPAAGVLCEPGLLGRFVCFRPGSATAGFEKAILAAQGL
jgi:hypothetical protein